MPSLRNNRACSLLGCSLPIVLAGMGGVARSELAAAVIEVGGFGFLGMVREPPELIEREVAALRARGHQRFGVNIIPAATGADLLERQVATLIRLAVPVVGLFWDIDAPLVARLKQAGIIVTYQVGSVAEALAAERAGADLIIAQGREAGGHVRGTTPLRDLLPAVVAAVKLPVVAAGGLASGADLVTALALGAEGVMLGTALMATDEAFAHPHHKQALVGATAADTILTDDFHINWPIGAPVRVLRSPVTSGALGPPHAAERVVIGEEEGHPIYLFSTDSPLRSMSGDFAKMALYAGTGVGHITAITPAGARIAAIMAEAEALLAPDDAYVPEAASPVCYADEIDGAYMGRPSDADITAALSGVAGEMRAALRLHLAEQAADPNSDAPPFGDGADAYARWSLLLGDMVAGSGGQAVEPATALQLAHLQSAMLARLGALLPGLAEGTLRRQLSPLRPFLETRQVLRLRQQPSPPYSSESPAASRR